MVPLDNVLELERKGEFDKALEILGTDENKTKITAIILKSRIFSYSGLFQESINILDTFQNSKQNSQFDTYRILISKAIIYINYNEYKLAENILNEIEILNLQNISQIPESEGWNAFHEILKSFNQVKRGTPDKYEKNIKDQINKLGKLKLNFFENFGYFILGEIQKELGNYGKSEKIFKKLVDQNQKIGNYYETYRSIIQIGIIKAMQGEFTDSENHFLKAYELIVENNPNKYDQAKLLNNLGLVMRYTGKLTSALNYFYKGLELAQEIHNYSLVSIISSNIGLLQTDNGLLDDALDTYLHSLPSYEKMGDNGKLAIIFTNLGLLYRKKGDLQSALEYYNKGYAIRKQMGNNARLAKNLQGIANIHLTQGNIEIAIGYLKESAEIWKTIGNELELASIQKDIGIAYQKKGQLDTSLEFLRESLETRKKIGNNLEIAESLFYYILAGMEGNYKEFSNYLEELMDLAKATPIQDIKTKALLAQAMFLQHGDTLNDQVRAHELLEEVLSKTNIDSETRVLAMLNLCEYLVVELKITGEAEIIHEIRALLDKLYKMASDQESHTLLIKILIIEAKLELIELNVNQAISILESALQIAESYGIDQSKLEITYLLDKLNGEIKRVINSKMTLDKRIEMVELESYIREVAALKSTIDDTQNGFDEEDPKQLLQVNLNLVQLLSEDKSIPDLLKKRLYFSHLSKKEIQLLMSTYLTLDLIENRSFSIFPQKINSIEFIKERIQGWEKLFDKNRISIKFYNLQDEVIITVDKILITRVLDNIIHNALKFTPDGEEFGINVIESDGNWLFTFFNSSPKIELDQIENLFDKYVQYDYGPLTYSKKGVGLGLAFCKKAVELHNGSIIIQSPIPERENGFQLQFRIPV